MPEINNYTNREWKTKWQILMNDLNRSNKMDKDPWMKVLRTYRVQHTFGLSYQTDRRSLGHTYEWMDDFKHDY